jgi:hypothetical protein
VEALEGPSRLPVSLLTEFCELVRRVTCGLSFDADVDAMNFLVVWLVDFFSAFPKEAEED